MKAIVYHNYGSPDVFRLEDIPKPTPGDGEMLIHIHATAVNPFDWHFMRGAPFFVRLGYGVLKPKKNILGIDIAGRVESVGENITRFQPGDEIVGDLSLCGFGGFAEYVCIHEKAAFALKPPGMTFDEAAAIPTAAVTALQGLRDKGKNQLGQKVLINGASGGVGTFAVQIAKALGAEVTGVCSTGKLDMVRSIGADHVIDYTREDFTTNGQRYDLILDNVGNRSVLDFNRALKPKGTCVVTGFSSLTRLFKNMFLSMWISMTGGKKIGHIGETKPNTNDLAFILQLVAAGDVTPVIERRYPLAETPEAVRYLEEGHARGKLVITM